VRFAIATTDRYLDVFQALVARAWKPVKVFTGPADNRFHSNTGVIDLAWHLKVGHGRGR
jgi:hypothetical protein